MYFFYIIVSLIKYIDNKIKGLTLIVLKRHSPAGISPAGVPDGRACLWK